MTLFLSFNTCFVCLFRAAPYRLVFALPKDVLLWGERKLMGENLKVVWAEFSTLNWAIFYVCNCMAYTEACLSLEL